MTRLYRFHDGSYGAALKLHIISRRTRSDKIAVSQNGSLVIPFAEIISEEETDRELKKILEKIFNISPMKIEIVEGQTLKDKLAILHGVDAQEIDSQLNNWLKKQSQ